MERVNSEVRLSPYLIAALTVGVILLAVLVVDDLEQQRFDRVREARILRSLSNVRARLESELNERVFLTGGLVAYVSTDPDIGQAQFRPPRERALCATGHGRHSESYTIGRIMDASSTDSAASLHELTLARQVI